MSVEKMQNYKEDKKNRKELLKKEKRQKLIAKILVAVVCVAILGGIGYGIGYTIYEQSAGTDSNSVNLDPINNYVDALERATATP